jgi:ribosomal protein L40E
MTGHKAAMRFCYKCGAEIPSSSTYCRVCGYRSAEGSEGTKSVPK